MTKEAIPFALATADAVQAVVCACHRDWARAVYWLDLSDDPADWTPPLMQRITTRKKHRVPRIEMLGNGQVPLCAAVAFVWCFEILRVIVEGNEISLRL